MAEKESGREDETKPVSPRDWSGEYRLSGLKGRTLTIARLGHATVGRWVGRTGHWNWHNKWHRLGHWHWHKY